MSNVFQFNDIAGSVLNLDAITVLSVHTEMIGTFVVQYAVHATMGQPVIQRQNLYYNRRGLSDDELRTRVAEDKERFVRALKGSEE